jgi:NAD(P)H-hydrate epimerase
MKIFRTDQIRQLDAQSMELEGITSIELMNRAAKALSERLLTLLTPSDKVLVLAGPGNNGGDALAVARLLLEAGQKVEVILCQPDAKVSRDTLEQLIDLQQTEGADIRALDHTETLDTLKADWTFLLDGLFGTGLNRPLQGYFAEVVHWINRQKCRIIAIDLPSGLFGEDNTKNIGTHIVRANLTLGLQFPRLAFLLPENEPFVGQWELVDIGIRPEVTERMPAAYHYMDRPEIRPLLKVRSLHAHKGTAGKVLLVAGSQEMTGAAILALRGALRSGAGLVYLRIPEAAVSVVQATVPEALVLPAETDPSSFDGFDAIAIGPGLGKNAAQLLALTDLLDQKFYPLVLDADALNFLAAHPQWLEKVPAQTILTPHPGEFDRLIGKPSTSGFERLHHALAFAKKHRVYVVLKGAYTVCIDPDGKASFNSTGNPGMATGGSGDVLTGIIVSLLAQGYLPGDAARLGVYLHGLSGDIALEKQSWESLIAGDLTDNLGLAFKQLENEP